MHRQGFRPLIALALALSLCACGAETMEDPSSQSPELPRSDGAQALAYYAGEAVVVYQNENFSGGYQSFQPGRYDIDALTVGNDALSSLKVPSGWRVTLYEHDNFAGRTKVFTADATFVGYDFNDTTSSILVEAPPYGATISILARANNRYVCAEAAGSSPLIANRTRIDTWETFHFELQNVP